MTFIVMIPMKECVIFGSDRATTKINGAHSEPSNEQVTKLIESESGFITGSGFAEILLPVKEAFRMSKVNPIETLRNAIANTQKNFRIKYSDLPIEAEEKIQTTSWFFSFDNNGEPTAGAYDRKSGDLIGLSAGSICTSFPNGVSTSSALSANDILNMRSIDNTTESLENNIQIIKEVALLFIKSGVHISEYLDFAIHHRDYRHKLSTDMSHCS